MTRMSRDINGITAWIKEAGVTVDYGNISIGWSVTFQSWTAA